MMNIQMNPAGGGMPQPVMSQPGMVGAGPGGIPLPPQMMMGNSPQTQMQQQQIPQPPQQQPPQQQQLEKMDNISKIKSLIGPLRENLAATFKSAATLLHHNNMADNLKKDTISQNAKFDKHLEEFYSTCDQVELHLKTAISCIQQSSSSNHYLPGRIATTNMEPFLQSEQNPNAPLSYPQFLSIVRSHVNSSKDIHDTLISAAQNISQSD